MTERSDKNLADVLETIEWGMKHFGSIITNRQLRRRDVLRAVKMGYAESVGEIALCDDDGFRLDPERYREGFVLTEDGARVLNRTREERRKSTE